MDVLVPRGGRCLDPDDVYSAMDWLVQRQVDIETSLAWRDLSPGGRVLL
ncbi:MAG: hypothetical protein ABR972_02355 [Acidimicrobiales bacterium]